MPRKKLIKNEKKGNEKEIEDEKKSNKKIETEKNGDETNGPSVRIYKRNVFAQKKTTSKNDSKNEEIESYDVGDLVFAKVRGFDPWPARIEEAIQYEDDGKYSYKVMFFGTHEVINDIPGRDIHFYNKQNADKYGKPGKKLKEKFKMALTEMELDCTVLPTDPVGESSLPGPSSGLARSKGPIDPPVVEDSDDDDNIPVVKFVNNKFTPVETIMDLFLEKSLKFGNFFGVENFAGVQKSMDFESSVEVSSLLKRTATDPALNVTISSPQAKRMKISEESVTSEIIQPEDVSENSLDKTNDEPSSVVYATESLFDKINDLVVGPTKNSLDKTNDELSSNDLNEPSGDSDPLVVSKDNVAENCSPEDNIAQDFLPQDENSEQIVVDSNEPSFVNEEETMPVLLPKNYDEEIFVENNERNNDANSNDSTFDDENEITDHSKLVTVSDYDDPTVYGVAESPANPQVLENFKKINFLVHNEVILKMKLRFDFDEDDCVEILNRIGYEPNLQREVILCLPSLVKTIKTITECNNEIMSQKAREIFNYIALQFEDIEPTDADSFLESFKNLSKVFLGSNPDLDLYVEARSLSAICSELTNCTEKNKCVELFFNK